MEAATSPSKEEAPSTPRSHPLKKGSPRDHWRLEHPEQRVLESGLTALKQLQPAEGLQRSGSMVLRASFFERLLGGHVELKACPANDVAAAQGDLKKLGLRQLLALRILTKGFPTTRVGAFTVHSNFLAALSSELLAYQIAGDGLLGSSCSGRRLEQIGQRLVLCLGAAELLKEKCPPPPAWWLTTLEEEDWPGSGFALVDICALTAQMLEGASADFEQCRGVNMAVVIDLGSAASINWEVITMDAAKEDIPAALAVLKARRRRSRRSTSLEETPEDSSRFPSLPFAADVLPQDGARATSSKVQWPSPTPQHKSPVESPKDSRFNEYPFVTDIFDYFGCCTRRRWEHH
ncbi:unnamed protein product [Effrenium voratum]|uniref:Uncharacterized protein n=1 Tax=Effrenium voratum TaxID=2562239 RepID=A0AA36I3A0_9DINO|nr:unnamed protein product [Effrenium voratum]CAJ1420593.1 unnamed protein product [Effrenium voratum]